MVRCFIRAFLLLCLSFAGWTVYLYVTAPVEKLRGVVTYTPPFKHYTRQAGLGVTGNLTLEDMPADLVLAILIGEDPDFPYSYGVNPGRIYDGLKSHFLNGTYLGGYSSIMQQLAKNIFTGPKRTLYRKYVELIYALKIERYFTKAEIFTLYVNMVQVGPDSYGFRQAARDYFGKNVPQLTDAEDAFMVTILPAPVAYSQWYRERRRDLVGFMQWNMQWRLQDTLILKKTLFAQGKVPIAGGDFFTVYFNRDRDRVFVPDYYNNHGPVFRQQAAEETKKFIERRLAKQSPLQQP